MRNLITVKGVNINYELLGRVLSEKRKRLHEPVYKDSSKYLGRVLSISKTIYPDDQTKDL